MKCPKCFFLKMRFYIYKGNLVRIINRGEKMEMSPQSLSQTKAASVGVYEFFEAVLCAEFYNRTKNFFVLDMRSDYGYYDTRVT